MKKIKKGNLTVVISGKGTGATTQNKAHIKRYVAVRKKVKKSYRVLIVDFNNEYEGVKINFKDVPTFKNKIAVINIQGMLLKEVQNFVEKISRVYKNGLLIIDGFGSLALSPDTIASIISCVRNGVNLLVGFNGLEIPLKIIMNCDYIRLHGIMEAFTASKFKRLYPDFVYELAQEIIHSKYQFVYIDVNNQKIFGCSVIDYFNAFKQLVIEEIDRLKSIASLEYFTMHQQAAKYFSPEDNIPI